MFWLGLQHYEDTYYVVKAKINLQHRLRI
jgi:hypothetical protein